MIKELLKFPRSFGAFAGGQVRLTPQQDGIEGAEEACSCASRHSQFVGSGSFKGFDGFGGIATMERQDGMDDRQLAEPDGCVLGEFALQFAGQRLRQSLVASQS